VKDAPPPADNEDARRRYYRLTEHGRRTAERESDRLARLVKAARSKKLLAEDAA
jgi:DNA-binding MarR family transcriptional regulator